MCSLSFAHRALNCCSCYENAVQSAGKKVCGPHIVKAVSLGRGGEGRVGRVVRQVAAHVLHHVAKFHFQTSHNNNNNKQQQWRDAATLVATSTSGSGGGARDVSRARLGPVKGGKHVDDATFWHFKRLQSSRGSRHQQGKGQGGGREEAVQSESHSAWSRCIK